MITTSKWKDFYENFYSGYLVVDIKRVMDKIAVANGFDGTNYDDHQHLILARFLLKETCASFASDGSDGIVTDVMEHSFEHNFEPGFIVDAGTDLIPLFDENFGYPQYFKKLFINLTGSDRGTHVAENIGFSKMFFAPSGTHNKAIEEFPHMEGQVIFRRRRRFTGKPLIKHILHRFNMDFADGEPVASFIKVA